MVVVRFQGIEHSPQEQQQQQADKKSPGATAMFKVPSTTHFQQSSQLLVEQQQQQQQTAKRKWHESSAVNPTFRVERPQQRLKSPPLTIFYGGSVNVYDNVPESMVRALMTLAAAKSSGAAGIQSLNSSVHNSSNNDNSLSAASGFGFTAPKQAPPIVAHPPQNNQLSSSSSSQVMSFKTRRVNDNCTSLSLGSLSKQEERAPAPLNAPASVATPPAANLIKANAGTKMQLGLPQARRASIQRFLEKRKHKQIDDDGGVAPDAKPDVQHFLR